MIPDCLFEPETIIGERRRSGCKKTFGLIQVYKEAV
jgi:hypothetical protein